MYFESLSHVKFHFTEKMKFSGIRMHNIKFHIKISMMSYRNTFSSCEEMGGHMRAAETTLNDRKMDMK